MLDSLITSKTRLKLLMRFFINSQNTAYLRNLSSEFGESTNGIRLELNRFEDAELLESQLVQNKKVYRANTKHPYYEDIHHLLLKFVGIDQIVEQVVKRVGALQQAYIINDFAQGKPGRVLDLLLVGDTFDTEYINSLVAKVETDLSFSIRFVTLQQAELDAYLPDKTKSLKVF
jgi:hypothetical protein